MNSENSSVTKVILKQLPNEYMEAYRRLYSEDTLIPRNVLIKRVRSFVDRQKNCKDGWLMLGDLYSNENSRKRCYQKALALDSGDVEANVELANLVGEEGENKGKVEQFLRTALNSLESYPAHRDAFYCLREIVYVSDNWKLWKIRKEAINFGQEYFPDEWDWSELPRRWARIRRRVRKESEEKKRHVVKKRVRRVSNKKSGEHRD